LSPIEHLSFGRSNTSDREIDKIVTDSSLCERPQTGK
jgi:hypothetical protein